MAKEKTKTKKTDSFAEKLQEETVAVRIHHTKLGVRKNLTTAQKQKAADQFDASAAVLSAGKKLLDTRSPEYKSVTSCISQGFEVWKGKTVPFPERGVRLLQRDRTDELVTAMNGVQAELTIAEGVLNDAYSRLMAEQKVKLGDLWVEADYPSTLIGRFSVSIDFPSVSPPDYLRQLSPVLYERQCTLVKDRFTNAVAMAEEAFADQIKKLIDSLVERLTPGTDGKKKVFRDGTVDNFNDFFDGFKKLNIGSNADLDKLITDCKKVMKGVTAKGLRGDVTAHGTITEKLKGIGDQLEPFIVAKKKRAMRFSDED